MIRKYFSLNIKDIKIKTDRFDELLTKLNEHGYLLKKGLNLYEAFFT
jgi:hypothetical protein